MNHSSQLSLLEESISLLIRHFGEDKVRATLELLATKNGELQQKISPQVMLSKQKSTRSIISNTLESIRDRDPEKYRLLSKFLSDLKDRKTLPESQDIRHFAHLIGLKTIVGKSRRDLIPSLMRFLLEQSNDKLRSDLKNAGSISELQRREGYSILTDKLLGIQSGTRIQQDKEPGSEVTSGTVPTPPTGEKMG
jgi:hypothetical protein